MSGSRSTSIRAAAAALALAAGAVGAVSAAHSADPPAGHGGSGTPSAALERPGPELAARALARTAVDTLAERSAAGDAVPERVAEGPLLDDGVVDLDTARRVRDDAGPGRSAWLASSNDGEEVCVVLAGGLTCPPVQQLLEEGASPGYVWRDGEPVHVFGVVADGVTDVALQLRSGRTQSVAVADNFFAADVAVLPLSVSWIGPDGVETFTFPARPGVAGVPLE